MTTRGCSQNDFVEIANFLDRAIKLSQTYKQDKQNLAGYKQAVDEALKSDAKVQEFKKEVEGFSSQFGFFY